jgi:hypothetical protein
MTHLELLRKNNNEYREQAVDKLISGGAKDYAEYRELVGVIRGLDSANLTIQDLEQRLESDNE